MDGFRTKNLRIAASGKSHISNFADNGWDIYFGWFWNLNCFVKIYLFVDSVCDSPNNNFPLKLEFRASLNEYNNTTICETAAST